MKTYSNYKKSGNSSQNRLCFLAIASIAFICVCILVSLPFIRNAFADFANDNTSQNISAEEKQQLKENSLNYKNPSNLDPITQDTNSSNAISIEEKYDFSSEMPQLRDQAPFGVCWAFAPMAAMEANLIKKGMADKSIDLSERQLAYFFYYKNRIADPLNLITNSYTKYNPKIDESKQAYTSYLDAGNNSAYSMWTLMSWCGPVLESNAPYEDIAKYTDPDLQNPTPGYIAYIMSIPDEEIRTEKWRELGCETWSDINAKYKESLEKTKLVDDLCFNSDAYHVTDICQIPTNYEKNGNSIKQQIKEKGAVASAYYEDGLDEGGHYDKETNSYYDGEDTGTNHAIALVGWDDNKDTSNGKGAWKVRNSWTNSSYKESHDGYFWISYHSACFNESNLAYSYDVHSTDDYDNNYQYDGTGSNFGYAPIEKNYSIADIYTAQKNEEIEGVSLGLHNTDSSLNLKIYTDIKDPSNPISGNLVYEDDHVFVDNAGSRFVPLKYSIKLSADQKFSVVFTNKSDKNAEMYIELKYESENDPVSYFPNFEQGRSFYGVINGQSSQWLDSCGLNQNPQYYYRIKAYTKNSTEKKDIANATVEPIESFEYTGEEATPEPVIKYDDIILVKDQDYTISYKHNVDVEDLKGKPTVIITGIGDYTNTKEVEFEITKAILTASAKDESINYINFGQWKPQLEVTGFKGKDKQIRPEGYVDPIITGPKASEVFPGNTYELKVSEGEATNNYKFNYVNASLTINKGNLQDADIAPIKDEVYNSKPHTPTSTVRYYDLTVESSEYDITYVNDNINVGIVEVIFSAKKNSHFEGYKILTFNITPLTLTATFPNCTVDYKDFDSANLDDKIEVTGFIAGETPETALGYGRPTIGDKPNKEPGAKYNLTPKNATATNYVFNYISGQLTINGAYIENVKVGDISKCQYNAQEQKPSVNISYEGKALKENEDYTLEYSNNIHVTNDAKVLITGIGNYIGTRETTFSITKLPVSVSVIDANIYYSEFDTYVPQVKIDKFLEETPLDYIPPSISGIPAKKDVKLGQSYEISASNASAKDYEFASYIPGNLHINAGISLKNANIENINDLTYNALEQKPEPNVTLDGKQLQLGKDYTLSYADNIHVNYEGHTPKVIVTGMGDYMDSTSRTFNITKFDTSVKFKDAHVAYDDYDTFVPQFDIGFIGQDSVSTALNYVAPSVNLPSKQDIRRGEEYSILPFGGSANDYNFTEYFDGKLTINPATDITNATVELEESVVYNGNAQQPQPVVKYNDKELVFGTDYDLTYSNNIYCGTAFVTISGRDAYSGTINRTFTINKAQLTASFVDATLSLSEYNAYVPQVKVEGFVGSDTESTARGYFAPSVQKPQSVHPGDIIDVVPSGGFASDYNFKYNSGKLSINPAIDINNVSVSKIDDVEYNGSAYMPTPVLTYNDLVLTLNKDYTLQYFDNIHATNEAKILINGIGDYSGSKTTTFKINKATLTATLENATINLSQLDLWVPQITVTGFVDSNPLEYKSPYVTKPQSAQLDHEYELVPEGGFAHDYNFEYIKGILKINPGIDLLDASFGKITEDLTYSATYKTPSPDIIVNEKLLTKGKDYEISYANNLHVNHDSYIPSMTVYGRGDYVGSVTKTFEITKAPLTAKFNDIFVAYEDYESYVPDVEVEGFLGDDSPKTALDYSAPTIEKPESVVRGMRYELTPLGGSANDYAFTQHKSGWLTINEATSILDASVELPKSVTYNGQLQTPKPVVKLKGTTLIEGKDYSLNYEDNLYTGTAKVVISGLNAYKDTLEANFQITKAKLVATYIGATISYSDFSSYVPVVDVQGFVGIDKSQTPRAYVMPNVAKPSSIELGKSYNLVPQDGQALDYDFEYVAGQLKIRDGLNIKDASVDTITEEYVYSGAEQKPMPNIYYNGQLLNREVDYKLSYIDNIMAGNNAKLVIDGVGNYCGQKTIDFTILKAPLVAQYEGDTIHYLDFDDYKFNVKVSGFVNGEDQSTAVDYKAPVIDKPYDQDPDTTKTYTPYGGFAANYQFVEYIPGDLYIEKLKSSDVHDARIEFVDVQNSVSYQYRGEEIKPDVRVYMDGKLMRQDKHYSVRYSDNLNVGTDAKVIVDGVKNFHGEQSLGFEITKAMLTAQVEDATVDINDYASFAPKLVVSGFVGKDTESTAKDYVAPTVSKPKDVKAGNTYTLNANEDGQAYNYDFKYIPGTLTITSASTPGDVPQDPSFIASDSATTQTNDSNGLILLLLILICGISTVFVLRTFVHKK